MLSLRPVFCELSSTKPAIPVQVQRVRGSELSPTTTDNVKVVLQPRLYTLRSYGSDRLGVMRTRKDGRDEVSAFFATLSDYIESSGPNGQATATVEPTQPPSRRPVRSEEVLDVLPQTVSDDGFASRHSHMKYELRDTPGLVPIGLYGFQHFISMLGSLVLIPLVIVPAMGGTYEDTTNVVSTVLFVSGVTMLLHTSFGSRLPLYRVHHLYILL